MELWPERGLWGSAGEGRARGDVQGVPAGEGLLPRRGRLVPREGSREGRGLPWLQEGKVGVVDTELQEEDRGLQEGARRGAAEGAPAHIAAGW